MGGRSSKTKPAQASAKSQNQDTEVQTFDMDGAVDEVHTESAGETTASTTHDDSSARQSKQPTAAASTAVVTGAATLSTSSKSSIVQDILDGRADNNLAPLSALYGSKSTALELQVSSSEDEDEEPGANKKHKRKKSAARKKKKAGADAKSPAKTPVLKPVKPPLHPPNQHTPIEPLARSSGIDAGATNDTPSSNSNSASEKPPATPKTQDPPATPKADSPSRFFAFSRTRKSFSRPSTSTRERDKASVRERSSGSPEKASAVNAPPLPSSPPSSSPSKQTGATSLERFMEWREGTYRSSGRESSTRASESPIRDELPGTADVAPAVVESNEVEDFDTLERETASALALGTSVRTTTSRLSFRGKSTERRSASSTTASPVVSIKSQRSSRSAGRNLNIDDLDENIMNDILAEAIDT